MVPLAVVREPCATFISNSLSDLRDTAPRVLLLGDAFSSGCIFRDTLSLSARLANWRALPIQAQQA